MSHSSSRALPRALALASLCLLIAIAASFCLGCGGEGGVGGGDRGVGTSEQTAGAPSAPGGAVNGPVDTKATVETVTGDDGASRPGATDTASTTSGAAPFGDVFSELAGSMHPRTVYGPTYLPAGAELADRWWPMLQYTAPQEYGGELKSNPMTMVDGQGVVVSAEILVQVGSGWLLLFQNLRGDLGDVAGKEIGAVDGRTAYLYWMGDLAIVQWSREGLWYGVAGRSVPESEVVRVGLGMVPTRLKGQK